jgi:hypothetical protein
MLSEGELPMAKYLAQNRQTGSFVTTDDTGEQVIVIVYQDVIATGNLTNPNTSRLGTPSLVTEHSERVNRLSKGEYEIVGSGRKLHSNDPEAI